MSDTTPANLYESSSRRRLGFRIWKSIAFDVWSSRELVFRLIARDITVRYKQSVLGYVWALLFPLATAALFTYLVSARVLPIGDPVLPYPLFALWSISVWQLFTATLLSSTSSLAAAGSLITKVNFPAQALVIAAFGQSLFDFLLRLIPVSILLVWYNYLPPLAVLAIPLILVPLLLLAIGLGFFFSILNLVVRDIGNAIGIILTFGMFATPVLYPAPVHYPFYLVNIFNPVSPFIIATQDLLTSGKLLHIDLLIVACLFSMLIFLVGIRLFSLALPRAIERA